MSAESVWSCLLAYNLDSAKQIRKQYHYSDALILQRLGKYPGNGDYHGHETGGTGDGEHAGAADNRTAAITFLKAYTPSVQVKGVVSVANKAKANANRSVESNLLTIISGFTGTIPGLEAALTEANGNWRTIRNVNNSFEGWKAARKARFSAKK